MKKSFLVLTGLLLFAGAAFSLAQKKPEPKKAVFSLKPYHDKNRLVLIFAPDSGSDEYKSQKDLFDGKQDGLSERDIVRFDVFATGNSTVGSAKIKAQDAHSLRQQFHVQPDGFCVLLIGKDGHTAYRSDTPVTTEKLFRLIDAMPMRRSEMKQRKKP